MADRLQLSVATPLAKVLDVTVDSVEAPSVKGEFGVLPNHLPVLSALKSGVLSYVIEGRRHVAAIGPGFVKAGPDGVELLTDIYVDPKDIDAQAANADLTQAEAELKKFPDRLRSNELMLDIEWAVARLNAKAAYKAI